jgi:hypothetical protein
MMCAAGTKRAGRQSPLWLTFATLVAVGCAVCVNASTVDRFSVALQSLPAPPQGQMQWIARNMRMNGVPMTLQSIQSRLSPDALFDFYESSTRAQAHAEYRRSVNGEWHLLAISSLRRYVTIQVRPTIAGSEGTVTASTLPSPAGPLQSSEFPRPVTSRIVNLQEYDDAGIQSECISLQSSRSAAIEAWAFSTALTHSGWQIIRRESMRKTVGGIAIEAQRGAQQAMLTLQPDPLQPALTAIVVVWKKS